MSMRIGRKLTIYSGAIEKAVLIFVIGHITYQVGNTGSCVNTCYVEKDVIYYCTEHRSNQSLPRVDPKVILVCLCGQTDGKHEK